jgi:hypothetical protein
MRFIALLKTEENSAAGPPPAELMAAIGKLGEEAVKAGVLLDTGGLTPAALGATVRLSGGQLTVVDGPFAEAKEVVVSYAVYDVKSKEEVVEWTTRFMQLNREYWQGWEGESEIRQVFGPDDFGPPA